MRRLSRWFVLVACVLFGRSGFSAIPDSLKAYYESVNRAELSIVEANYAEAIALYDRAFQMKDFPYCRDIYNQAVCAVLVEDYSMAAANLENLCKYGYELDSLLAKPVFDPLFSSPMGEDLVKTCAGSGQGFDHNLRQVYDSLLVVDQLFRIKEGSYAVYGDTIAALDESNATFLVNLIESDGFPTEEKVGTYLEFDYESFRMIVFHNNVGSRSGIRYDFTEILYEAVETGELDVRVGIQLIVGSTGMDDFGFEFSGLVQHGLEENFQKGKVDTTLSAWGFYSIEPDMEREIDERRAKMGLCSLDDFRAKTIYGMKDPRFNIDSPAGKRIFYWKYTSDYERAMQNTEFLFKEE